MPHRAPSPGALAAALGGAAAMAAAIGIGRFAFTPILPAMLAPGPLDAAAAGLIASANFAGYLAGALLAAAPRLPGGRDAWLLAALAGSVGTSFAMAGAADFATFALLRFLGGIASAFALVLSTAVVLDRLAAAGRAGLGALHFAGVGAGIAMSAVVLSPPLAGGLAWQGQWIAAGGAALVLALLAMLLLPREGAGGGPAGPPAPAQPLPAALRRWIIAYGLFGFGYVVTATFLVAIVRLDSTLRSLEPLVWLLVGLTAAPSVHLWARLGRRLGPATAFAAAAVLEAAGVAASVLLPGAMGALAGAVLLGGTFMGLTALGMAAARAGAGADARRALGLMTAAFGAGQIAGPALAGGLHAWSGSFVPGSLIAAAALLGAAILVPRRG